MPDSLKLVNNMDIKFIGAIIMTTFLLNGMITPLLFLFNKKASENSIKTVGTSFLLSLILAFLLLYVKFITY